MEPTIGISCLHFEWKRLSQAFQRCAEDFGFQVLELSTTCVRPEQYTEIRALRRRYGLDLSLHAWTNVLAWTPEDAGSILGDVIDACGRMEASHLILHMGMSPDRAEGLARLREIVTAAVDSLRAANVMLCLENHYPFEYKGLNELGGTPEDVLTVLQDLPADAVGFCLDYGHANMTKNCDQFLEQVGPRLVYTHLADNMGEHDDHLSYGEGNFDWDAAFRQTADVGYRGPFIVEFPEKRGREHIDRCVEHIRRIYRERGQE